MNDLTLVIMAAGMGSRFGGLKQVIPVGLNGEFILDYAIYDAIKAGFKRVVLIIKEEHLPIFKDTIGKRVAGKVKIDYAFQKLTDIPPGVKIPENRVKPWGTAQAVLAAQTLVSGPFVVINADDYYGPQAYETAYRFFKTTSDPQVAACITYPYHVTTSKYGKVKRAVCYTKNNNIIKMVECAIITQDQVGYCEPLNQTSPFTIALNHPVSLNMYCLQPGFFKLLTEFVTSFFTTETDLEKAEVLLPDCITHNINQGRLILKNQPTKAQWLGVTYRADLAGVKRTIHQLIKKGVYPVDLWH